MVTGIQKTQTPLLIEPEPEKKIPHEIEVTPKSSVFDGTANAKRALAPIIKHNAEAFIIAPTQLGDAQFRKDYGIKYAYLSGAMYRGIASKELVIAMGKAGFMGFLGTGGMKLDQVESELAVIQSQLVHDEPYGMNLLCNLNSPEIEMATVELYLKRNVRRVEAAAFMQMTPALVLYRVRGLQKGKDGKVHIKHQIIAKVSRPEVAEMFMSPPPERLVAKLLAAGKISVEQAELAQYVPMSYDICVEADSGGHTNQGVSTALLPAIQSLRAMMMDRYHYEQNIRIGLAGGIGTPQAVAAAFIMGADFVLTGSINQCTIESGASDSMKNLLQEINVQDTDYAPAGDMFEIGARVQVLKKGVFFPIRANKLHMLYTQYDSLDEIPESIKAQVEEKYFKRSFASIWQEIRQRFEFTERHQDIQQAETNPKRKMAWIFRWYFHHSTMVALNGDETQRMDYQVHTGPALGAFNQWVKGTALESWKNRHVAEISKKMMDEAAILLSQRLGGWVQR